MTEMSAKGGWSRAEKRISTKVAAKPVASEANKGRTRATKGLFGWVKRLVGSR